MRLEQFYHIVAVAQTKSISQAAERCYISQPALSSSVSKLEVDLGALLFKRTNQGVFPTETGEAIIEKALEIIDLLEDIKGIARENTQALTGTIHLAVDPSISNTIMANILTTFKYKHPNINVLLKVGESSSIVRDVAAGRADIGIFMKLEPLPEEAELNIRHLFRDRLSLICGGGSAALNRTPITLRDALSLPLVLYNTDYTVECALSRYLGQYGRLNVAYQLDSFQMLEQVLSLNSCAAFVPEFMCDYFRDKGEIVSVEMTDTDLSVTMAIGWCKRHPLSLIEKELIATIKAMCSMCEFLG